MTNLAAFLTARIDEDEAAARATTPVPVPGRWAVVRDKYADAKAPLKVIQGEDLPEYGPMNGNYSYGNPVIAIAADWQRESAENLEHIARHDPSRVRHGVAARRRILARHRAADTPHHRMRPDDPDVYDCVGCGYEGDLETAHTDNINECPELRDLAAEYADHPDYDESWRPDGSLTP